RDQLVQDDEAVLLQLGFDCLVRRLPLGLPFCLLIRRGRFLGRRGGEGQRGRGAGGLQKTAAGNPFRNRRIGHARISLTTRAGKVEVSRSLKPLRSNSSCW